MKVQRTRGGTRSGAQTVWGGSAFGSYQGTHLGYKRLSSIHGLLTRQRYMKSGWQKKSAGRVGIRRSILSLILLQADACVT